MIVLGLNYRHGDASACIIKNGKLLFAAEEERFTKIKNCSQFPINSIKFCLTSSNIKVEDIDIIATNHDPKYNLLNKAVFFIKNILRINLFDYTFNSIHKNNYLKNEMKLFFGKNFSRKILNVSHHLSHALSTLFFLDDNSNSLVFSFDGSGDFSTIESFLVNQKKFDLIDKNVFPHSLGFYYMAFTQYLGFLNFGDEYKVMGLSAFGKPIYVDIIKKHIIKSEYPLKLNLKYFNIPEISYHTHRPKVNLLFNGNFIKLLGKPRKENEDKEIAQIYKDYAASMQKVFEEIVFKYLYVYKKKYNPKKIYITGGCALNGLLVGKIIESKLFESVNVGPNPGDAGGAVGAAFYPFIKNNLKIGTSHNLPFSGPNYSNQSIQKNLIDQIRDDKNFKISFYDDDNKLSIDVAKKIKDEKIIFWFQDGMEWGPRALGNRSILADPTQENIKEILNSTIKKRELFRPFAPMVLEDYAKDYFYMNGHNSKFMNVVFKARNITKKKFPCVVHHDNTSRVQTVNRIDNKKIFDLISNFYKISDSPMLINTSLNIQGPIAMTPMDAFQFFKESNIKTLIINNWIIENKN